MIASEDDGSLQLAALDGFVEGQRNLCTALTVGIEDACLRPDDEFVLAGLFDPVDVVGHLTLYVGRRTRHDFLQHLSCQTVGCGQVGRIARRAYPAERPEAVVEEHRSHDVLHVAGIAEGAVGFHDVGTGTARFEQERVAIVEEIHALGGQLVDGGHLSAQRGLHLLLEESRVLGHHLLRFFERKPHGIVTAGPRIMERGLVAAQVDVNVLFGQTLPQVNDVAHVCHRDDAPLADGLAHGRNQFVKVLVQFVHPSLLIAFARSLRIDLCRHAHHTGNVARLRLGTAHAAETGRHEQLHVVATHLTGCVQHGDGGAVDDALRTDVHIRASRHLSVLAHTHGVHALPVVGLRVVGNHHSIGHHYARSVPVRGEKSQRMSAVHHERLLVGHLGEIFHHQTVLCPVLEDGSVAAVDDQFVRMLRNARVEVVLNHEHDGGRLTRACRIFVNRTGEHLIARTVAVHVDAAVGLQLLGKLRRQLRMQMLGEIAQCVAQGQPFLFCCEDIFAFGRMVDVLVVGHRLGQRIGDA